MVTSQRLSQGRGYATEFRRYGHVRCVGPFPEENIDCKGALQRLGKGRRHVQFQELLAAVA
jgi:hypothetical protein